MIPHRLFIELNLRNKMQKIKIIFIIKWGTTQTATIKIATTTAVIPLATVLLTTTNAGITMRPKQPAPELSPEPLLEQYLESSSLWLLLVIAIVRNSKNSSKHRWQP